MPDSWWTGCLVCNHRFEVNMTDKKTVRCPGNCSPCSLVTPPRKEMERCDCTPKPDPTPRVFEPRPADPAPQPEKKGPMEFRFL